MVRVKAFNEFGLNKQGVDSLHGGLANNNQHLIIEKIDKFLLKIK